MLSYIQKNRNRKKLRDILPVPMPLGLCVEPTNFCNFKCVQCPVSLDEFDRDEVNIESPMNWNGYNGIDLISMIDPDRKTDETCLQGYYGMTGSSGRKQICTTPFLNLNIKSNGDAVICIVDWNRGTKVGNLREEGIAEIWFGERLRAFREMHIRGKRDEHPSCGNCKFLYGSPDNMDDFTEEEFRNVLNFKGKKRTQ